MAISLTKIATYVYGTGVLGCIGIGIHQENLKLEHAKQKGINIKFEEYAIHSFGGAGIGMISGIMWPLAVVGRLMVMFTPK